MQTHFLQRTENIHLLPVSQARPDGNLRGPLGLAEHRSTSYLVMLCTGFFQMAETEPLQNTQTADETESDSSAE